MSFSFLPSGRGGASRCRGVKEAGLPSGLPLGRGGASRCQPEEARGGCPGLGARLGAVLGRRLRNPRYPGPHPADLGRHRLSGLWPFGGLGASSSEGSGASAEIPVPPFEKGGLGGISPNRRRAAAWLPALGIVLLLTACAEDSSDGGSGGQPGGDSVRSERGGGPPGGRSGGRSGGGPPGGRGGPPGGRGGPGGFGGFGGGEQGDRGVPVEVATVARRPISSFLETQGTLEAENEVDLVARTTGPIVELKAEEGMTVREGQLLARIDDREIRAQLEVSKVRLEETRLAYERAKQLRNGELVSQETLDQALANYQSAQGDFERLRVQLLYTEITAPFNGLIVERYVRFAEHLSNGSRLFRLSDFHPLLCPIQVPERELPRLQRGQAARLEVEAYRGERFDAKVLRISPVVDAATGTIRVTLEVEGRGKLRPGMFASVYLEMERRPEALVIPKSALALDSLGDTVFVAADGLAVRRAVELGFQNDDLLEVRAGVEEGEPVIVVGQDGLSEGTPIEILRTATIGGDAPAGEEAPETTSPAGRRLAARPPGATEGSPAAAGPPTGGSGRFGPRGGGPGGPGGFGPGGRGGFRDLDLNDPEQVERIKGFMRQRGFSDEEIEERLKRMRERRGQGS